MKKSLARIAKDARVTDVSDETADGQGYWIYLRAGWINPALETHLIHEYTLRECEKQLRGLIPCDCEECKSGKAWEEAHADAINAAAKMQEIAAGIAKQIHELGKVINDSGYIPRKADQKDCLDFLIGVIKSAKYELAPHGVYAEIHDVRKDVFALTLREPTPADRLALAVKAEVLFSGADQSGDYDH